MTAGTYGGGAFGFPQLGGFGGGLYVESHGNLYPQVYYGTPKLSLSAGYSPNLEELLTGLSVSGSVGTGPIAGNFGTSATAPAIGFGTPGAGATYGFGPYQLDPAPLEAIGEINPAIYPTGFDLPSDPPTSPPSATEMPTPTSPNSLGDETQQSINNKPERYLRRRVVNQPRVSQFDVAPSLAADGPKTFADRFRNSTASPDGGISPGNPNRQVSPLEAGRPLGIVSGQPMPDWITPPPIFGQRNRSKAPVDEGREWLMRMIRSVGDY